MISDILIADKLNQRDSDYMVIEKWIPENEQNILFNHTKKLRSSKLQTQSVKEPMLLVRKTSPGRKGQRERNTDDLPGRAGVESRTPYDND